jgi:RimJ/RimL family protein N-acetyltransferase
MPDPQRLTPTTLAGRIVRLEPMSLDHLDGLAEVAFEPTIWQWTLARPTDRAGLEAWIRAALDAQAAGTDLPFVTVERSSGRPIGSSRYLNIAMEHRRLEIGWTWVGKAWQRSGVNREAKLLMLQHAIERLGCRRVEFKTDSLNEPARVALLGIGTTFEGIFRNHMVMPEGRMRHSAWYSVIDAEWPVVKERLVRLVDESVRRGPRGGSTST